MDDMYWIEGEVTIPGEKREVFNKKVMTIRYKCGMRKTVEMECGGRRITVVDRAVPDKDGIVRFDYCIFEKKKRQEGTYDMNTCMLQVSDRGYNEYGLAMNLIMLLQESYTNGHCYVMYKDKPLDGCNPYMNLLENVLGERHRLDNRGRVWDMYLFLRDMDMVSKFGELDLVKELFHPYVNLSLNQFFAYIDIRGDIIKPVNDDSYIKDRTGIESGNHTGLWDYLYRLFQQINSEGENQLREYLKLLLDADLSSRKKMAEREDVFGIIAEISLYVLPSTVVSVFAITIGKPFWETWDSLGIKGYSDLEKEKMFCDDEETYHLDFYRAILRDHQDEFLEFKDVDDSKLSDKMKDNIKEWCDLYRKAKDIDEDKVEKYLSNIVDDLYKVWHCRYADKIFITEFLDNRSNPAYRKALVALIDFMNKGSENFPELTPRQAARWMTSYYRGVKDSIFMSAFQSLLINHSKRMEVFGF